MHGPVPSLSGLAQAAVHKPERIELIPSPSLLNMYFPMLSLQSYYLHPSLRLLISLLCSSGHLVLLHILMLFFLRCVARISLITTLEGVHCRP